MGSHQGGLGSSPVCTENFDAANLRECFGKTEKNQGGCHRCGASGRISSSEVRRSTGSGAHRAGGYAPVTNHLILRYLVLYSILERNWSGLCLDRNA